MGASYAHYPNLSWSLPPIMIMMGPPSPGSRDPRACGGKRGLVPVGLNMERVDPPPGQLEPASATVTSVAADAAGPAGLQWHWQGGLGISAPVTAAVSMMADSAHSLAGRSDLKLGLRIILADGKSRRAS